MTKDFDDDDDLEELEDDDFDGEEDASDYGDYDDDLDDLEELDDEGDDGGSAGTIPFATEEEADELREEEEKREETKFKEAPPAAKWGKEEDDDDSSFFDETPDEGDDLGLDEPTPQVAMPVIAATPSISAAPSPVAEAVKPGEQGLKPVFYILPAIGILLGIGLFFFKGEKSEIPLSRLEPPKMEKIIPPSLPPAATFIKPKIDDSIPDYYEELKRTELSDPLKIALLIDRGLLKKRIEDSSRQVKKLTLVLYKTDVRYVVSQTYFYTDGGKWTVETQFSGLDSEPEEVTKAFDAVYSG